MSDSVRPIDCSPPSSSIHGIFQTRVLEWVAISFSGGSSRPRDQTQVYHIAGRRLMATEPGRWLSKAEVGPEHLHSCRMLLLVQGPHFQCGHKTGPLCRLRECYCPSPHPCSVIIYLPGAKRSPLCLFPTSKTLGRTLCLSLIRLSRLLPTCHVTVGSCDLVR